MTNPSNIPGANVTIVGNAVGPATIKEFAGGSSIAELSIAVNQGYKKDGVWVDTGTAYYVVTATADYAADNWPVVDKGDKVRLDEGKLETREFTRKDETAGIGLKVTFGTLSIVEAKADRVASAPSGDSFTPESTSGGF